MIPKRIRNQKTDEGRYVTDDGRVFHVIDPCGSLNCRGSIMSFIDGKKRCSQCSRYV